MGLRAPQPPAPAPAPAPAPIGIVDFGGAKLLLPQFQPAASRPTGWVPTTLDGCTGIRRGGALRFFSSKNHAGQELWTTKGDFDDALSLSLSPHIMSFGSGSLERVTECNTFGDIPLFLLLLWPLAAGRRQRTRSPLPWGRIQFIGWMPEPEVVWREPRQNRYWMGHPGNRIVSLSIREIPDF